MPEYAWEFQPLDDDPRLSSLRLEHLPDTCFWKSRLRNLFLHRELWDAIGFVNRGVYLFAGPIGSGRHMTGSALIGELPSQHGTNASETVILQLRAEDFPASMTEEEAAEQVNAIFEASEGAPLRLIVFDAMDQYAHLPIVSNAIADCVEAYDPEEGNLAVICYVEDASKLSFDLRSMALILRTNEPSERQRMEFLEANMHWEVPDPTLPGMTIQASLRLDGISLEEIIAGTEGFSYGDLVLFVRYLYFSSLDLAKSGATALLLFCSGEAVQECLDAVKQKKRQDAVSIIQMQQMVDGNPHSKDATNPDAKGLLKLAKKDNRSVTETLTLIDNVPVSEEPEDRKG